MHKGDGKEELTAISTSRKRVSALGTWKYGETESWRTARGKVAARQEIIRMLLMMSDERRRSC